MTEFLSNFHFLRPLWLTAVIPAGLILYAMQRKQDRAHSYKQIIAPHLLSHLLVGADQNRRFSPIYLLALLWLTIIFALAGPTFQQELSPFAEENAAVMLVLKVTDSMLAEDIKPSRLV